jgi:type IV pilus assembly protein PilB
MKHSLHERVIDLLVEHCGVDRERMEALLHSPKAQQQGFLQALVKEGLVDEEKLLATIAGGLGCPPIRLDRYRLDPSLAALIPPQMARRYRLVPISRIGNQLCVAMADPLNILALDDLALATSLEIRPVIATAREVESAILRIYGSPSLEMDAGSSSATKEIPMEEEGLEEDEVIDLAPFGMADQRAPVVRVVDMMIQDALHARASDIHIEPYQDHVRIRYRIDGDLWEAFRLPKRHQNALTTRLKIMARLDITENRLPQDGRFKARIEGREVDFRVSVLPIGFGNKIVLRILDRANLSMGLEQLGFLPDSLKAFQKAIARPYGLILVTGPTGSGKSTTLYSVLSELNDPSRNILTVEDPVEYQMEGVTQVQVNPEIGLNFAQALRAFLRQAPDVVLVGEIRDAETADIAIKASLTGQIVLSTLHTNDAVSAITRLIDMGVDPFLLASSLVFVAAQRLCRQICPRCKVEDERAGRILAEMAITPPLGKKLYRGAGCSYCRQTGYRGRFAILEALLIDDAIREMIIAQRSLDEIRAYAQAHGMRTLRQEGLEHCWLGRTSVEEVLRVT